MPSLAKFDVLFTDLVQVDWSLETHVQLEQLGTVEQQVAVQYNETFTKFLKSAPTFMIKICSVKLAGFCIVFFLAF